MAIQLTKFNKKQDVLRKTLKQKETAKISSSLVLKYFGMIQMILYQTKSDRLLLYFGAKLAIRQGPKVDI